MDRPSLRLLQRDTAPLHPAIEVSPDQEMIMSRLDEALNEWFDAKQVAGVKADSPEVRAATDKLKRELLEYLHEELPKTIQKHQSRGGGTRWDSLGR
jgi:hypothetical protein